jgi:SAM-dependent methyltransferase
MVKQIMAKNKLTNVETILSQCDTGLKNEALDAVLLYDVFHGLEDQTAVLNGLHRVLKPNGLLSFSDHHMQEEDIVTRITASGQFKLQRKNKHTYSFVKQN